MSETRLQAIGRIVKRAMKRTGHVLEAARERPSGDNVLDVEMLLGDLQEAFKLTSPAETPTVNAVLHSVAQAEQRLSVLRSNASEYTNDQIREVVELTLADLKIISDGIACGQIGASPARPAQLNTEMAHAAEAARRADHIVTTARAQLGGIMPDVEDRGCVADKIDVVVALLDREAVHLAATRDAIDRALAQAARS